MLLLVDNSNRTTKLGLADTGGLRADTLARIPSTELTAARLAGLLPTDVVVDALVWASVTAAGPTVLAEFARVLGVPGHGLDGGNAPLDLGACPEPMAIGPDRLANALAAAAMARGRPAIAIDAGTAITFNVVTPGSPRPAFLGGAIAPGLGVFTSSLHAHTARLPEIRFPTPDKVPPPIGPTTDAAMHAAAWHGAAGMVRGILAAQAARLGAAAMIILTGTDAPILAAMLDDQPVIQVPTLTLDGLRLAAGWLLA